MGAVVLISAAIIVGLLVTAPAPITGAPPPEIPDSPEPSESQQVRFLNHAGGYRFVYPQTWHVIQKGRVSRLESPTGNIVLSFGVSSTDRLERASTLLIRSRFGPDDDGQMIGTTRRRIAGVPAFLTGGLVRDETGDIIRYLSIAIDGASRTYTILITTSVRGDPEQVLAAVEEIVTSFETSSAPVI